MDFGTSCKGRKKKERKIERTLTAENDSWVEKEEEKDEDMNGERKKNDSRDFYECEKKKKKKMNMSVKNPLTYAKTIFLLWEKRETYKG